MKIWGSAFGILALAFFAQVDRHPSVAHPDAHPDIVSANTTYHPELLNSLTPIARYEFNDPADLGHDSGGNGYDLTPVNTPTATGGATGYAADFDAATPSYASIADNASLSLGSGVSYAYVFWAIPETDGRVFVAKGASANSGEFDNYYTTGVDFACRMHDGVGAKIDVSGAVTTGSRHFLACRYNATTNELEAATDNTWSGSPVSTAGDGADDASAFTVAAQEAGANPLGGKFSSVMWYRSASGGEVLTDAIATSLYNSGKGLTCAEAKAQGLDTNGVSCWDMNEDGGPYVDQWGSNNLTGVNTPTQAAALVDQPESGMSTWLVPASSQGFSISDRALDFGTNPISICAWAHPIALTGNHEIVYHYSTIEGYVLRVDSSEEARFQIYDGSGAAQGVFENTVNTNEWQHVCGTYSSNGDVTVWWNGVAGGSVGNGSFVSRVASTYIGSTASSNYFDGAIDSVLIFDKDIGQAGVTQLYNSGVGVFYAFDWTWEDPLKHFAFAIPTIVKTSRSPEEIKRRFYVD